MAKNYSNPGIVNTNEVVNSSSFVKTSVNNDGSSHTTVVDKGSNRRFSYDQSSDGKISNAHSTNQNNNSHTTYKGGK